MVGLNFHWKRNFSFYFIVIIILFGIINQWFDKFDDARFLQKYWTSGLFCRFVQTTWLFFELMRLGLELEKKAYAMDDIVKKKQVEVSGDQGDKGLPRREIFRGWRKVTKNERKRKWIRRSNKFNAKRYKWETRDKWVSRDLFANYKPLSERRESGFFFLVDINVNIYST